MLAVEINYLSGRVYAAHPTNPSKVEWPPHPSRLFAALVSAYHETHLGDQARQALLWLEQQGPPEIQAGSVSPRDSVGVFVPPNYAKDPLLTRSKRGRHFPSASLDEPVVHFVWPGAQVSSTVREILSMMLARVGYLGTSSSQIMARLTDAPVASNYVPDDMGDLAFRVPARRQLEGLEWSYKINRQYADSPYARYRQVSGQPKAVEPGQSEMIVFKRTEGLRLPVSAATAVSVSLRRRLIALADEHDTMTSLIHGHDCDPHCAYVPLPFVGGHQHADGHLMGVAIVVPAKAEPGDRQKVYQAVAHLESFGLPGSLGHWRVQLTNGYAPQTLQSKTWVSKSARWGTVTPLVLDRHPRGNRSVKDIVTSACRDVGLPEPAEVESGQYSTFRGVPAATRFRRLKHTKGRPMVHATITFSEPVAGPILLGAGRYFGLGLLRAV